MRIYEINYTASGSSSEEELKSISSKISGFISENGGKTEKTAEPVKKFLGFQIGKEKNIFFTSIIFSIPEENLAAFEKSVKGETSILRYNILKRDKVESDSGKEFIRRRRKPTESLDQITEKEEHTKPKKVELKEIDEKIEEILSE